MTELKKELNNIKDEDFGVNLNEMNEAGLYFGHRTSRIHPKMKPYISASRNGVDIIDLEKTALKLKEALSLIKTMISENKIIVLVGTKIQVKKLIEETAKECGLFYITDRWLGGTFTNFKVIRKRIEYFKDLENKKQNQELSKYTKKERLKIDKELRDLEAKFRGIKNLERIPDAIFVFDIRKDSLAVKEAKREGVKVFGITDTNTDPTSVDYPIPANDDAISSVKYILEKLKNTILEAKK
ncbi:MAG: 30S ribosomal protein S2 [Candidatus Pacebacteria bacterium]|nr:30S ribosomal protein S2 [Candidatus Paceibacterota bacterium]